ncbi:MAG TPA: cellulase family glycosylhydrolase [Thermoguttaceae bacterium]|nr:cellulase family glycosylhydrolase [Thermoguttaceae bacterium]
MNRRHFLRLSAGGIVGGTLAIGPRILAGEPAPKPTQHPLWKKLPRWRGFNLVEKFMFPSRNKPFVEQDFQWMADWGFDFVRLPMDYRCWTDPKDPYKLIEKTLAEIDQAVEWGRKYGIHVCLNFHRAPGYTVARPPEKLNLWKDEEAQKQFAFHWAAFARRYRGVKPEHLSLNLVNEPAGVSPEDYAKVARRAVDAIRKEDPQRLIIADGRQWGREPVWELVPLEIAQSTRGYEPMQISHYQASWVNAQGWPLPTWPLKRGNQTIDRQWLRQDRIEPWKKLADAGVGVHVGEWGAYNKTPHEVVLRWMRDCLTLWKEAGWGWALWNFRGSFGVLDSDRTDVAYEDFHGHKLDRKMLDLLREF